MSGGKVLPVGGTGLPVALCPDRSTAVPSRVIARSGTLGPVLAALVAKEHRMILFFFGLAAGLHDLAALEAAAAVVAGAPVTIDRRLRLAACPAPAITRGAAGLTIACLDPAWRINVPAQPLAPIVKRGDTVSVAVGGPGFHVAVEGIAESDASVGGRLRIRSAAGGHLIAIVLADGSLAIPGYTLP